MSGNKGSSISYPAIAPVPADAQRPFWSVMIPTYNRDALLRTALASVLAQDPGPEQMQIEVLDNCSTQVDVAAIVREMAGDRVTYFRQPENIGLCGNWNSCVERARGHWLQILPDDDAVLPGFYQSYRAVIQHHPEGVLVYGRTVAIDDAGEWLSLCPGDKQYMRPSGPAPDTFELMLSGMFMLPCAVVMRRDLFSETGGFYPAIKALMDWEMYTRFVIRGTALYHHHPLALMRAHDGSETSAIMRSGEALRDTLLALDAAINRLPAAERDAARAAAYRNWSELPQFIRVNLHRRGEHAAAMRFALKLMQMNPSPGNFTRLLISAARAARGAVQPSRPAFHVEARA